MQPKISVILPALNVVPFIGECLDSVAKQTLGDIEIIIVDAGSTDGTLNIINEYAASDQRIRLLHSEVRSYGYQVNMGINAANGEYIAIVETDDYIVATMLAELFAAAEKECVDVIKGDFDMFITIKNGKRLYFPTKMFYGEGANLYNQVLSPHDFPWLQTDDINIWKGLYNRRFLNSNNIRCYESAGAAYQDIGFHHQIMCCADRILYIDQSYYRYRRDNVASSSNNPQGIRFMRQEYERIIKGDVIEQSRLQFFLSFIYARACKNFMGEYEKLTVFENGVGNLSGHIDWFRNCFLEGISKGYIHREYFQDQQWLELQMFLQNPELYEQNTRLKVSVKIQGCADFLELMKQQKEIVIFGCGHLGKSLICFLERNDIHHYCCFCDNDRSLTGKSYAGVPILLPDEAISLYPKALFVIANRNHSKTIRNQLKTSGISDKGIYTLPLSLDATIFTSIIYP